MFDILSRVSRISRFRCVYASGMPSVYFVCEINLRRFLEVIVYPRVSVAFGSVFFFLFLVRRINTCVGTISTKYKVFFWKEIYIIFIFHYSVHNFEIINLGNLINRCTFDISTRFVVAYDHEFCPLFAFVLDCSTAQMSCFGPYQLSIMTNSFISISFAIKTRKKISYRPSSSIRIITFTQIWKFHAS